jgi:hypothetical protein
MKRLIRISRSRVNPMTNERTYVFPSSDNRVRLQDLPGRARGRTKRLRTRASR